jgi:hypothetical protein
VCGSTKRREPVGSCECAGSRPARPRRSRAVWPPAAGSGRRGGTPNSPSWTRSMPLLPGANGRRTRLTAGVTGDAAASSPHACPGTARARRRQRGPDRRPPSGLAPLYTVAQVTARLAHDPAAWVGKTVRVRGGGSGRGGHYNIERQGPRT